jgi:hypothetical protein
MSKLKTLPWTQILLALLLLSSIGNLVEMSLLREAVKQGTDEVETVQSTDEQGLRDVYNRLDDLNDTLKDIDSRERCIEDRSLPGCLSWQIK